MKKIENILEENKEMIKELEAEQSQKRSDKNCVRHLEEEVESRKALLEQSERY